MCLLLLLVGFVCCGWWFVGYALLVVCIVRFALVMLGGWIAWFCGWVDLCLLGGLVVVFVDCLVWCLVCSVYWFGLVLRVTGLV